MLGYRAEIDGLRAIAVASVLLFHAGFSFISGGFVGVDVFFVISGYLITSIILREMELDKFSFARFYERRAKRLLPPLVPVMVVSTLLAFSMLDGNLLSDFSRSLYSAVGFVANWYFLQSVSYFGGPGEQTPLLHLWSLSIEEQFYFIFPALLLILFRARRNIIFSVSLLALLASAAYSIVLVSSYNLDGAFYNSIARFWELLVGAVLAIKPNWRARGNNSASILEVMGVTMILGSVVGYTSNMPFPGLAAGIPVFGAALIIAAEGRGYIVSPVLKSKAFVSLGLISYALYLWHWPVLVFTRMINPGVGHAGMALAICGSLVLAAISYFFIECPIRNRKGLRTSHILALSVLSSVVVIGLAAIATSDRISKFHDETFTSVRRAIYPGDRADMIARIEQEGKRYLSTLNVNFNAQSGNYQSEKFKGWTCSYDFGNSIDRLYECISAQAKDENVLVMGDSIGRDTTHALRRAYPGTNFIMLHQSSCPPGDSKSCFNRSGELLDRLSGTVKFKSVIINFRYLPAQWVSVASGIEEAKKLSPNVILMGVSPMFSMTSVDFIKSIPASSEIPLFIDQSNTKLTQWDYSELALKASDMAKNHNVYFVNVLEFFCPQKKCRVWVDNRYGDPLFFDQQHLTNNGIDEFSEYLKKQPVIYKHI